MTIAGVGTRSATRNDKHGPLAVMLNLMNPPSAFGRLVGQAGKLRRDKAKARGAGHAWYLTGLACRVRVSLPRELRRTAQAQQNGL
jgi:hypothetical protein